MKAGAGTETGTPFNDASFCTGDAENSFACSLCSVIIFSLINGKAQAEYSIAAVSSAALRINIILFFFKSAFPFNSNKDIFFSSRRVSSRFFIGRLAEFGDVLLWGVLKIALLCYNWNPSADGLECWNDTGFQYSIFPPD